jgi:TP901 family phage tail tape measure protein
MSNVNGESVNTMDTLSALAKKMGSETAFSASDCADALNYLALAGYNTEQMCDTLPTVLNLAAAGNIDLATASDM